MRLYYHTERKRFETESSYEERMIPKSAKFRWDATNRCWYTTDIFKAQKLIQYADEACKERIQKTITEKLTSSSATNKEIQIPAPNGKEYLPYQKAGIAYALEHKATLLADEMGLGKTIQAIGVINADNSINRVLVICPASLRLNWAREMAQWLVREFNIYVVENNNPIPTAEQQVVICNYDRLKVIPSDAEWDLLIVDEAHYLKNPKAQRTKKILGFRKNKNFTPGIAHQSKKQIFLTGTPILNRPIEIYPIASFCAPKEFGNFWSFVNTYCNAQHNGWGWDFRGAANLDELQTKLRYACMVRRLKKDVLSELPAKIRQVVVLPQNGAARLIKKEQQLIEKHQQKIAKIRNNIELHWIQNNQKEYEKAVAQLRETQKIAFSEISRIRHQLALAKVPAVVEHVQTALEQTDKIVIFAHHKDVIQKLTEELQQYNPVIITGDTKLSDRQNAVDKFQSDPDTHIFIGSITAAGVGITLTAASHVIFAELDWVPANMNQAEDRCHRIGQQNMVLIQHLVFDGTLDQRMIQTLIDKQKIIDSALDHLPKTQTETPQPDNFSLVPDMPKPTPKPKRVPKYTDEIKQQVLHGLRYLASLCDGAHKRDGYGFNRFDAPIGHSLANMPALSDKACYIGLKLLNKYKRQLLEAGIEIPKP